MGHKPITPILGHQGLRRYKSDVNNPIGARTPRTYDVFCVWEEWSKREVAEAVNLMVEIDVNDGKCPPIISLSRI